MSIVIDELEALVLQALPGDNDVENASYLRCLVHRLTLTADDLDPEPGGEHPGSERGAACVVPRRAAR